MGDLFDLAVNTGASSNMEVKEGNRMRNVKRLWGVIIAMAICILVLASLLITHAINQSEPRQSPEPEQQGEKKNDTSCRQNWKSGNYHDRASNSTRTPLWSRAARSNAGP